MTPGRLIGVVGPSGAGKDTVMHALAGAAPRFGLVQRVITRPPEAGGENHVAVSAAEFDRRVAAGAFCLHWAAHGLRYGIPQQVEDELARGRDMLVNLSRGVLGRADSRFAGFVALNITAGPETRAARLAKRGRETAAQIRARLDRMPAEIPPGIAVITVANDGELSETVAMVLAKLEPRAPAPVHETGHTR